MSKWRPEGWENNYRVNAKPQIPDNGDVAYEAGADAMLEALSKGGGVVKDGELKNAVGLFIEDGIANALNLNGKLVFIPNDE